MTGLYLHVPFCARKCPYCDFYSEAYQKTTASRYVEAVVRNIRAYAVEDMVDTIYFGGGTPSLLSEEQLSSILNACAKYLHLAEDMEITLELNPTGDRAAYLKALRAMGINRLSIGTQSFSDAQLALLGRTHSAQGGVRTVMAAHAAGFRNLSCDLMLACPEQTEAVLAETLTVLATLPITHVSAYLLQVEEGTPLAADAALLEQLPDGDASADRYLQTVRTLADHGFRQYEVSSFAKPGYESRHNRKYWQCEPYLGIGPGAHSCYGGKRFLVPKEMQAFCDAPMQPIQIIDEQPCQAEERLMLALRTADGVEVQELSGTANARLPQLLRAGYVQQKGNRISLTPEGYAVSNAVIGLLLG